jgi:hypothetical protein
VILDCQKYRIAFDNAKRLIEKNKAINMSPVDIASNLCLFTSAPLAACMMYTLLPEICGPDAELQKSLEKVLNFYRYSKVIPFKYDL